MSGDKSFVTLEQHVCIVCGQPFDTGALLLDRRLGKKFEHHTITGTGMCPEHQKLYDEGYLALVAADPEKSKVRGDKIMSYGDAWRTGEIAHIRREKAREIFNIPIDDKLPMMYCDPQVVQTLQAMMPKEENDSPSE